MRVLFCGLGGIGQRHLRLLRELRPNAKIAAFRVKNRSFEISDKLVADRKIDILSKYDIRCFGSISEAVAFKPDLSIVANPTSVHVDTARKLIEHGIPVFVEKPLSDGIEGVDELLQVSSETHIPVFVGYMMRFHPAAIKMKKLVDDKVLGKIYDAHVVVNSYFPDWHPYEKYNELYAARKELGGGVVLTEIHEIDLLCWYFGVPNRVASMGGKLSDLDIDVEDTANILIEYSFNSSPVIASVHLSFVQKTPLRQLTISGEYGSIQWDISMGVIQLDDFVNDIHQTWDYHQIERNDIFRSQMDYVLRCVEGRVEPEYALDSIKASQATAVAILQSLRTGQFEEVR